VGRFYISGDTLRLVIRSNFFFWVGLQVCSARICSFLVPAVWMCEMSDVYSACGTNMNVYFMLGTEDTNTVLPVTSIT